MTKEQFVEIVIETIDKNNGFRDLSPKGIVEMTVLMIMEIYERGGVKVDIKEITE